MEQATTVTAPRKLGPRFMPPEILWYFGALATALAGDALIGGTSGAHRGIWILLVGLVLMGVVGAISAGLYRLGRTIPGGVLAAAVVWLAPPTGVGLERLFGVHLRLFSSSTQPIGLGGVVAVPPPATGGGFHGAPFSIVMGTVAVGLAVYWLVRFAFVLLPVVVSLAVAVLLFLPAVVSNPGGGDDVAAALITGILFCVAGLVLDARQHRGEAFWLYVAGLFEVAIAFTYYLATGNGWVWFVLLVVALVVLLAAAPVSRAVWAVYGVIGVYAALVHYVESATGSWRTTLLLAVLGGLLLGFGVLLDVADSRIVRALTRPAPWLRPPPPPAE